MGDPSAPLGEQAGARGPVGAREQARGHVLDAAQDPASPTPPSLSRRTLVRAAAWAVPAVAVAVAVPAAAASDDLALAIDVEDPIVDAWMTDTKWLFVRDTTTDAAFAGAVSVSVTAGGAFENEPVTAPVTDGWAGVALVARAPAVGAVSATVVVTTGSGTVTRTVPLVIKDSPSVYVTLNAGSVDPGDPVVIAGGASPSTYRYAADFGWQAGPAVMLQPVTDPAVVCTLTDATGRLLPATVPSPATAGDLATAFYPLGAGTYGDGEFALHLAYRGYTADRNVPYRVADVAFIVQGPTAVNHIDITDQEPFPAWFRIMIDNGLGGALAGASVTITDLSAMIVPPTGLGAFTADAQGVIQPSWTLQPAVTGTGTLRFAIANGGYSKTVDVTYATPTDPV